MTFLEAQQYTAAMLGRDTTEFTLNGFNVLAKALNNACERAQRLVDFEYNKRLGYMELTNGTADFETDMLTSKGGSATTVKKIISLYADEDLMSAFPLRTESDLERLGCGGGAYVLMLGTTLKVMNISNAVELYAVYQHKLPALATDGSSNFLLEHCGDYIVFQAMFELQHYMKEDDRIQLSAGILRDKWDSVLAWNSSLESEQDLTLV